MKINHTHMKWGIIVSKRGSGSSARAGGTTKEVAVKELDKSLIRRADDFSLFDAGSATNREYNANVKKIQESSLSADDKKAALEKLHSLTTEQLKSQTKVANPYVSGPARFNENQVRKAADATVAKRQNVNSFMKDVQKKSTANKKAAEMKSLSSTLSAAMEKGALEVSFGGKTYYRKRKNSSTWRIK